MTAVPRPAATVILVRDAPQLQVFLQRRVAGMAFAGGMTVFPGGGVDATDRAATSRWRGRPPAWWAERLGCDDELAAAFVRAAVRETFEECGVLLAGPGPAPVHEREALVARTRTLDEVLGAAELVLDAELLRPWARWVTPEQNPRRYDTAFFVAAVPEGQTADAQTTEAVEATWWEPAEALAEASRGGMTLMAPTIRALEEMASFPDVAAVLAASETRRITTVRPQVLRGGDAPAVVIHDENGEERVFEVGKPR